MKMGKVSLNAIAWTFAFSTPAFAQQNAADPASMQAAAEAASPSSPGGIQDIVVTAQRRSENLQRAAIAVTAVNGDALRAAGVSDPKALTTLVPSLQVAGNNGAYTQFYLRGVGNVNANPLTESAVAFNYDGVYIGRPNSTTGYFYDLERVEVLKGPQGTLYGRNATGGAINVITRKPDFAFGADASAEYGNYDAVRLDGALNVPLSPVAAIRAAGIFVRHDGYMKDGTDDQHDYGGRIQLRVNPSDDLEILLSADYFHQGGRGAGGTPVDLGIDNRYGINSPEGQAFYHSLPNVLGGRNFLSVADNQYQRNNFWGVSANLSYSTDAGTFTIIPAYRRSSLDNVSTTDGFWIYDREKNEQTSVEARYASPESNPLRLLVGAYYYNEDNHVPTYLVNHQFDHYQAQFASTLDSYAGFARLTYALRDNVRVTGGIRYTHERKTLKANLQTIDRVCLAQYPNCPDAVPFPYDTAPIPVTRLPDGTIAPVPGADGTLQVGTEIAQDGAARFNRVTWRAGADWDITPRNLLYASFETGFKSGGFFLSGDEGVFKPETIKAWTLGSKNRFFDNRLQLNLEAFYWRYTDQQVSHLARDSAGTTIFATENVGRASFKGVELEAQFKPLRNTLLTADVLYLDARYKDFVYSVPNLGAPPASGCAVGALVGNSYSVDCSGRRPPQAPVWTINLGAQQTVPLANDANIVLNVRTHYQSSSLTALDFVADEYQQGYWMSDAQLTYNAAGGRWYAAAFINNIENTTVMGNGWQLPFSAASNVIAILRAPRTYGGRIGVRF